MGFSDPIERLIGELTKLPGIGPRSARRLGFYLLKLPTQEALELARAIEEAKEKIGVCERCFSLTQASLCKICSDESRDAALLCVVEDAADILPLERTSVFKGRYHVLGGALSPLDGIDPEDLRIEELLRRVEGEPISEVILATNPTMTGEATALYIADRLSGIRITRLASGLPLGADLEYADELTLGRALTGRQVI